MCADTSPTYVSDELLVKMQQVGICLDDQERRKYIKTVESLGHGSFGKVREAYCVPYCPPPAPADPSSAAAETAGIPPPGYIRVAIKEIDLAKIKDEAKRQRIVWSAIREAALLRRVRGAPHLIQSFRPWYNARRGRLCFPMEMADMDLLTYLKARQFTVTPGFLLAFAYQMLGSLQELHERRIVHRDVKLENFLVFTSDHQGQPPTIKLADFGLSAPCKMEEKNNELVGTPYFMAPECFQPRANAPGSPVVYGRDVWAVGCMLFIMAHDGAVPFDADDSRDLRRRIAGRRLSVGAPAAGRIEMEVLHQLALRCLEVDTTRRPTVSQVLQELNAKLELLRLSPLNRELLVPLGQMMELEQHPGYGQRTLKLYQLMRLCRPGYTLKVHAAYPTAVPHDLHLCPPIATLQCGKYVLVDCEFELPYAVSLYEPFAPAANGALDAASLPSSGATPSWTSQMPRRTHAHEGTVQRWAKMVYPVRGFCRSEENGHHVFHPYHLVPRCCAALAVVELPGEDSISSMERSGRSEAGGREGVAAGLTAWATQAMSPMGETLALPHRAGPDGQGGLPLVRLSTWWQA